MRNSIVMAAIMAALLATGPAAVAQPASELLEKGIYTEETVGDLEAAIAIYEKIVADAQANRSFAAQAQYRLGQCLLKQEKKTEATEAFQKLIDQFADQKELVAQARKFVPETQLKLDPVPWADGEALQLDMKLAGGLKIGALVVSVRAAKLDARDIWQIGVIHYTGVNTPNRGISRVAVDRQSFQPIASLFRHTLLGNIEGDYSPGKVKIRTIAADGTDSTREMDLDGVYYDNEQGMELFRRLPMAEGYKDTVPICTTMGDGAIKLEVEVTAKETIEVPAGKFECYRLLVKPVHQAFWISADEHRYLAKIEAGGVVMELASIRHNKPGEPVEYRNDELGFSLAAPTEWYLVQSEGGQDAKGVTYGLIDPEAVADSAVVVQRAEDLPEDLRASARAWADHDVAEAVKVYKDFKLRPDSWQTRKLSGHEAVSFVADYLAGQRKTVKYTVYVLGESTAAVFSMKVDADQFDAYRKSVDAIIETCKVK
jgi:hypothetical protein